MKKYLVYFKNENDTVYMAVNNKGNIAYATLNINEAITFSTLDKAKQFIAKVIEVAITKNVPDLHIFEYVEL